MTLPADCRPVPPAARARLAPLFAGLPHLRGVAASVLEGMLGEALVVGEPHRPAARLEVGCYAFLAGDARQPAARALAAAPCGADEYVCIPGTPWPELLQEAHGGRLVRRDMDAYLPGPDMAERVAALAAGLADGYTCRVLDADLATRIGPQLAPNRIGIFGSAQDFVDRGLGFAALPDGESDPACACTSYTISRATAEVCIGTHPDHRRRGLATAVAARLLAACLAQGREPHWHASNPVSQRMALRLGFVRTGVCEVLWRPA